MNKKFFLIAGILGFVLFLTGCEDGSTSSKITWTCKDVTSYDYNWNNDMKCTSSLGDVKYTSYEGARVLESL